MDKSRAGKNNSNWKGDKAKKRAKHYRVEVKNGAAKKCSVCGTTDPDKTYEWAQLNGGGWKRMCRSCHSRYDKKQNNFHEEVIQKVIENIKLPE